MAVNILVFVEQRNGAIRRSSFEALSEGKRIAAKLGGSLSAILIGGGAATVPDAETLYVVDDRRLDRYTPEGYAHAILEASKRSNPAAILFPATTMGKDLAPTVAAMLETTVAVDCIKLNVEGSRLTAVRPVYAGKLLATVAFRSSPAVISLRPNLFSVDPADASRTPAVEKLSLTFGAESIKSVVHELVAGAAGKIELTEANIVVSGGRGMKAPENFRLIEELAGVLGAAVGASRAVVDAGWRPHAEQVGQTGKTVSPNLYIACGISGAIQHLAGISSSNVIVAVNKDPEAAIFKAATYGIVGDVMEVLPALTKEFRQALA
ncbi:MAG: hypothetical protein A2Z34_00150 [Planctomycetes bacterium RBG_16_59_8]|nr:MAG: hypothetical protein A2Z34_00150 [Planctomycetes bacterium RBG_16_59_8]